jgi:hypothetical protein
MQQQEAENVYAVVYQNPDIYDWENDDIHQEVIGVYDGLEEAQATLTEIQQGNPEAAFYTIESWSKEIPF